MNLLNKLTIKNLKLNKKRTIVTIIGIMLSVALITAVSSIYASAINSITDYEKRRNGDFHVSFYEVPISEIQTLENNREVESINLTQNIGYAKIDSKNGDKPYAYIKAFTKSSLENLSIRLVEGRLPENDSEILIPTHLKTNGRLELNVGEEITLEVGKRVDSEGYELKQNNPYQEDGSEKIIDTTRKTYKIVGRIERPASNIESYTAPGYTFITYFSDNKNEGTFDIYLRLTKDGLKDIYKIIDNISKINPEILQAYYSTEVHYEEDTISQMTEELNKAKYSYNINNYLIGLETNPIGSSSLGGLGAVVGIVLGIIVFTSVFCIKNSFDISITEKIRQYGMLRSIGATKSQIRRNVFYEASILGTIGIPLGILAGHLATIILIVISNYFLEGFLAESLVLKFSFSWLAIFLSVILGMVTIYFSAFRSARRASKVSPIDSIRNSGDIKINPKKVKSPKLIKKIFGIGGEISYKNLKRNKKKYRTTVISITVSVLVFIALFSFMTLSFETIENELNIREANISLSTSEYKEDEYKKIEETTTFDNIEKSAIIRQSEITYRENYYSKEYIDFLDLQFDSDNSHYFTLTALGKTEYMAYIKKLGLNYEEIKDKAILCDYEIVSNYIEEKEIKQYMKIHDLNKGDTIKGKLSNSTECSIEIGEVTSQEPFGLESYNPSSLLIISDELFDKITSTKRLLVFYKSNNAEQLQDDIEEHLKDLSYNLYNYEENSKQMNNFFTLIGIFLYGFITVISLIGITNIFNTITTNMELRRRDFAMLKSIGMTKKEFNRMIRLETIFMGLKALFFGIPIGILLSYIIYTMLAEDSGIPYSLPILAILIAVGTVFILLSFIMRYSLRKIAKQNTIETIRNENI